VYKVFSKVIEEKIAPDLEDNNILGESQGFVISEKDTVVDILIKGP
jgi:ketol-acid reductoisomerase